MSAAAGAATAAGGGGGGGGGGGAEVQALTLKVMRLCKPSFRVSPATLGARGAAECLAREAGAQVAGDAALDEAGDAFATTAMGFGNIFVGEQFRSYVCLNNQTFSDVSDAVLRVELQTPNTRVSLLDMSATPIKTFESGKTHDFIVTQELRQVGVHILVCTADYVDAAGVAKNFRKFFRFQVLHPLSVKTRLHTLQDAVFVEAQIQNSVSGPIFVDRVNFEASDAFEMSDLNTFAFPTPASFAADHAAAAERSAAAPGAKEHTLESDAMTGASLAAAGAHESMHDAFLLQGSSALTCLPPGDTRQYLFRLDPKVARTEAARTPVLGRFSIAWKTSLGEEGQLLTNPLQRRVTAASDLVISVTRVPDAVYVQQSFAVGVQLENMSDRRMQLRMYFEAAPDALPAGVVPDGVSGQPIELDPHSVVPFDLTLFPVREGVHAVSGLRLADVKTEKVYEGDNLCDVFVVRA